MEVDLAALRERWERQLDETIKDPAYIALSGEWIDIKVEGDKRKWLLFDEDGDGPRPVHFMTVLYSYNATDDPLVKRGREVYEALDKWKSKEVFYSRGLTFLRPLMFHLREEEKNDTRATL